MIRRPPRSTRVRSSAASDVYKRQGGVGGEFELYVVGRAAAGDGGRGYVGDGGLQRDGCAVRDDRGLVPHLHLRDLGDVDGQGDAVTGRVDDIDRSGSGPGDRLLADSQP